MTAMLNALIVDAYCTRPVTDTVTDVHERIAKQRLRVHPIGSQVEPAASLHGDAIGDHTEIVGQCISYEGARLLCLRGGAWRLVT